MARMMSSLALALGMAALLAAPAWAGDKTWTGATSTTWSTATNWLPLGVPAATDRAIIPLISLKEPVVTASTTIGQLVVQPLATVTVNNGVTLTIAGTTTGGAAASPVIDGTGTVQPAAAGGSGLVAVTGGLSGGTVINASITLPNFTFATPAATTLAVAAGQIVTITGNATVQQGQMQVGSTGGAAGLLAVQGTLLLSPTGVLSMASGNLSVGQSLTDNGTFNAGVSTTTMTGTGTIGGTAASLLFNNLLVSGATTSVVTARMSFSVGGTFQVVQGALSTAGAAGTPVTLTALQGMQVGDGFGAAGSAGLNLRGTDVLAIASGRTFSVNATDGLFSSLGVGPPYSNSPTTNPTLTHSGAGTFTATVGGQASLMGLNFSFGDANGLAFAATAGIQLLRNLRFTNLNAAAGSHFLTLNSAGLNLDCPGCYFDTIPSGSFNVWAVDTAPGGTPVRLRFENRTSASTPTAIGGPGAGYAFTGDDDTNHDGVIDNGETTTVHGGAIIQWVYTADIDMTGSIQGFPEPAFDWNTFVFYSTYAVMRQAAGASDLIYVLNSNGDVQPGLTFAPGAAAGNILGPLFWDTEGTTHVVYFGTSSGLVYKLIDTGAGLVPPALPSPWNTPFADPSLALISTPVISDQTNVYFGGNDNQNPGASIAHWGMYRIQISTKTMPIARINLQKVGVTNASSWADTASGREIFQASSALTGVSNIYRILTTSWTLDATLTSTTSFTAPTNLPFDTVFVGEQGGRMHAVAALGTPTQFVERTGFPFTANASPISGGAIWEPVNPGRFATTGGRLFFGTGGGTLYTLYLYPATWTAGTNYYALSTAGGFALSSMPLAQSGIVYVSNSNGNLFVIDADTGAGPQLIQTYNFTGGSPLGDVSRDSAGTGRIYVADAAGHLYSILPVADPTPNFP